MKTTTTTAERTPPATIERTLALLAALENLQTAAEAVLADDAEACLDLRDVESLRHVAGMFASKLESSLPADVELTLNVSRGEAWARLLLAEQRGEPVSDELRRQVRAELAEVFADGDTPLPADEFDPPLVAEARA